MSLAPILCDEFEGLAHGFFTRKGGVSGGVYAGLNCGAGSQDDPAHVRENRARVAGAMGLGADELISVHQCHSARAVYVDGPVETPRPQCDAMVSDHPGLALGILTADCAPILLADRKAGVVAAAHAGWRGALGGVLGATIDLMCEKGAARGQIAAVVGPCISQAAYEVGPEFLDSFLAEDAAYAQFFAGGKGDRMQFDLPSFALSRLHEEGLHSARWTGHCTFADEAQFFSYRRTTHRNEADYGRLIAAIRA